MIAISFTLKGQPFEKIKPVLEKISQSIEVLEAVPILVHGFMPRHVVVDKGFSTEVVDALDEIFPLQLNCYVKDKPARATMAGILSENGGNAYIIGEIKEGVKEECDLYVDEGLTIVYCDLEGNFYAEKE